MCLLPCVALISESPKEGVTTIYPHQTFEGDYYALGDTIDIQGRVTGNVYLLGTQITISGLIEGSVYCLSGSLDLSGKVEGKVLALSGRAFFSGELGKSVYLLAADANFSEKNTIENDLLLCAGSADLRNWVGESVTALATQLKLGGFVEENVSSVAGRVTILSTALIRGNLKYRSNTPAFIDPQAAIGGEIIYKKPVFHSLVEAPFVKRLIIGSKIAAFLMNFFYTFVIGLIIIRLFPRKLSLALQALETSPLKAAGYGTVLLVLFPLAALILLVTVIGAPFALTLIALNVITFYTAKFFTILWIANKIFTPLKWKKNGLKTLACGQILYAVATAIPYLGAFVAFAAMILGLGAVVVFQKN